MRDRFHQALFVNSGAEANENAIKLARAFTGRREIISTQLSFHGRTYGSLSATGIEQYRAYLNSAVTDHRILPFAEVEDTISEETAGVLIEPIQSMGGVIEIPPEILQRIELACREKGAMLIFDEIQTGVGRTGSFLYSSQLGVRPQLTTLAKGIASGYPAGALLVTKDVAASVKSGDLGSTFGGHHAKLVVAGCDQLILTRVGQQISSQLFACELVKRQICIERLDHIVAIG